MPRFELFNVTSFLDFAFFSSPGLIGLGIGPHFFLLTWLSFSRQLDLTICDMVLFNWSSWVDIVARQYKVSLKSIHGGPVLNCLCNKHSSILLLLAVGVFLSSSFPAMCPDCGRLSKRAISACSGWISGRWCVWKTGCNRSAYSSCQACLFLIFGRQKIRNAF